MINQNSIEITSPKKRKHKKNLKFKNLLFFLIWLYFLLRLFGLDIDLSIAQMLGLQDIKVYFVLRLIIVLLIIFTVWHLLKSKRFFKNVGLLFLFPIYPFSVTILPFFLWYFPRFLIRKKLHFLFYSYVELILNFFAGFKKNMIKILSLIFAIYIMVNMKGYWLLISAFIFFILMIEHIFKRYKQIFAPVKIFRLDFTKGLEKKNPFSIEKMEKGLELKNEKDQFNQDQILLKQIEQIIMMSIFGDFLVEKIKKILTNRTYLKSLLWKILYSFLFAMFLLAGINYSIYQFNYANFKIDYIPNFFNFFYYSFFTIIPDGTDITPATELAKAIRMGGVSIGILLNLLILTFYFLVFTDKYKENLSNMIEYFEKYSKEANDYVTSKSKSIDTIEKLKNDSDKLKSIKIFFDALFGKSSK